MSSLIKPYILQDAIRLAVIAAIVKIGWLIVETGWLSFHDIDYVQKAKIKPLYFPTHFSSSHIAITNRPEQKTLTTMRRFDLLAVYHSAQEDIVTVSYGGKTEVVARGEKVGGFELVRAGVNYAIFQKGGKQYRLLLKNAQHEFPVDTIEQSKKRSQASRHLSKNRQDNNTIILVDKNRRIVPRDVLERYTKDLKEVYRNIGLNEVRKKGKIQGFKVTFIRRGSTFAKLGLRRGDILMSINGETLDSYKAAFDAYRNIQNLPEATLKVKRGNKTMELKYEID